MPGTKNTPTYSEAFSLSSGDPWSTNSVRSVVVTDFSVVVTDFSVVVTDSSFFVTDSSAVITDVTDLVLVIGFSVFTTVAVVGTKSDAGAADFISRDIVRPVDIGNVPHGILKKWIHMMEIRSDFI